MDKEARFDNLEEQIIGRYSFDHWDEMAASALSDEEYKEYIELREEFGF